MTHTRCVRITPNMRSDVILHSEDISRISGQIDIWGPSEWLSSLNQTHDVMTVHPVMTS